MIIKDSKKIYNNVIFLQADNKNWCTLVFVHDDVYFIFYLSTIHVHLVASETIIDAIRIL